jgi:nucleoside phosphorylase/CheY-like chemotaxis protein
VLNVLVIEDELEKFGKIHEVLTRAGVEPNRITHALTAAQGTEALARTKFDLLLLDINVPRRIGEHVRRGAGLEVLAELSRDTSLLRPSHIVGITAYEDLASEFGGEFSRELWSLVLYSENSDDWITQIRGKVTYLAALKRSGAFSDGVTYGIDLAIVCALEAVELGAVRNLPLSWQDLRLRHDETRYIMANLAHGGSMFSLVAGASPRMGMPAAAVLASKMIAQFRPRYLAMVGICAGRSGKVGIGDIIVANPSWDWGSGKVVSSNDGPRFLPSPHQIELDIDLASQLAEMSMDVGLLATIKAAARGRKPDTDLHLRIGPLASGAAVVADKATFDGLLDKNRDVLGLEMEAYAVCAACKGSGRPRPTPIIMKAVCDFADEKKADDFQEYAAHTSALALYHAALKFL